MDSELSIDAIVTALHLSLDESLKVSLGPFVDKFNSSRDQFNVVSDLLKQLPEYKELMKENQILKHYIQNHCRDNNRIKLNINEINKSSDEEASLYSLENKIGDNIIDIVIEKTDDDDEELQDNEDTDVEVEKAHEEAQDNEDTDVEVEKAHEEAQDNEETDVEVEKAHEEAHEEAQDNEDTDVNVEKADEELQDNEETDVNVENVHEDAQEKESQEDEEEDGVSVVEESEDELVIDEDDEISNNDASQVPRSVVDNEDDNEEEEGELFEIEIGGKDYFTEDDDNGNIYGKISEDEPTDDAIGVFKDGVPTFF